MEPIKKLEYSHGDSKMENETRAFNKRAFIGSFIIHVFFMMIRLPHLELEHKLKDDPKLIPVKLTSLSTVERTLMKKEEIKNKLETTEKPVEKKIVEATKKVDNGSDVVVKNSKALGDPLQNKVQDVQKGDPRSKNKTAYDPNKDLRKLPKNSVGTGGAKGKFESKDGNTGGSGDTYKFAGSDMQAISDSINKNGKGLKRFNGGKHADDGGAGSGTGGSIGDGAGGGSGDGRFTGSTNGTVDTKKIATNIGSLTGSAKGTIDSSKGAEGLSSKGSISVAGMPAEKIALSVINPDEIRRLLREHISQFKYCYQSELDRDKNPENLQGRINFKFKIGPKGRVTASEITAGDDGITSDKVRGCIKDVLNGIQFPVPNGGKTVEVYQPMNFYPKRI